MIRLSIRSRVGFTVLLVALSRMVAAEPMATVGEVAIHDAWAPASLGATRTSAAYLTLEVTGDQVDRLIAVASPVAEGATLHTHVMDGGVARMRPLAAIEIAPGAPTVLEPGGLHIMLSGLEQRLVEGETFPLSLTFESAGTVDIEVPIMGMAGMRHGRHGEHPPATN
ncbi:MAG: copper chaperone PCu(A)C [Geminicoccaceae bacterium]